MTTGGFNRFVMKPATPITHTEDLVQVRLNSWVYSTTLTKFRSHVVVSIGSKYTLKTHPLELGVEVRDELLKFHSKYYSSNLMTLAVVGKGLCVCVCCLLYTSPSPRDATLSRMPSSA